MTFEGPGQGELIRKQKIPFRHDWEKIISPVIDYALSRFGDTIDPKRIALMGNTKMRVIPFTNIN